MRTFFRSRTFVQYQTGFKFSNLHLKEFTVMLFHITFSEFTVHSKCCKIALALHNILLGELKVLKSVIKHEIHIPAHRIVRKLLVGLDTNIADLEDVINTHFPGCENVITSNQP